MIAMTEVKVASETSEVAVFTITDEGGIEPASEGVVCSREHWLEAAKHLNTLGLHGPAIHHSVLVTGENGGRHWLWAPEELTQPVEDDDIIDLEALDVRQG